MNFPDFYDYFKVFTSEPPSNYQAPVQFGLDENGYLKLCCLPNIIEDIAIYCKKTPPSLFRTYHIQIKQKLDRIF